MNSVCYTGKKLIAERLNSIMRRYAEVMTDNRPVELCKEVAKSRLEQLEHGRNTEPETPPNKNNDL